MQQHRVAKLQKSRQAASVPLPIGWIRTIFGPMRLLPGRLLPALLLLTACQQDKSANPPTTTTPPTAANPAPALPPAVPPDSAQAVQLIRSLTVGKQPRQVALLLDSAARLAPGQLPGLIAQANPADVHLWLEQRTFRLRVQNNWNYRLSQLQDLRADGMIALRRRLLTDARFVTDPEFTFFLHVAGASLADTTERQRYIRQQLLSLPPADVGAFLTQLAAHLQQTNGLLAEAGTAMQGVVPGASDAALRIFWQQTGWLARPKADELALLPYSVLLTLRQRLPRLQLPPTQSTAVDAALANALAQATH